MERIIDIVSVVGGFLGMTVIPVVLATINRNNKKAAVEPSDEVEPHATFGIPMSAESAVDRGDRIANDYLADLRSQRDEAKTDARAALQLARDVKLKADVVEDRLDECEQRLDLANAALRAAGLPTF